MAETEIRNLSITKSLFFSKIAMPKISYGFYRDKFNEIRYYNYYLLTYYKLTGI